MQELNEQPKETEDHTIVHDSRYWLITLLAVVVTALLVGGGVWWWMSGQLVDLRGQVAILETQVSQEEGSVSLEDVDVSDWETFRNEEKSYEIQYPAGWNIDDANSYEVRIGPYLMILAGPTTARGAEGLGPICETKSTIIAGAEREVRVRCGRVPILDEESTGGERYVFTGFSVEEPEYMEYSFEFGIESSDNYQYEDFILNKVLSTFKLLNDEDRQTVSINDPKNGIIEGSLSYPSQMIPPSIVVCAENLSTQNEYCTSQHITDEKYDYNVGYRLEVPAGTYYVFATGGSSGLKDKKAYYNEFVTCGLRNDCPSHEPIGVVVEEGKIISQIDPHDWYAQN